MCFAVVLCTMHGHLLRLAGGTKHAAGPTKKSTIRNGFQMSKNTRIIPLLFDLFQNFLDPSGEGGYG